MPTNTAAVLTATAQHLEIKEVSYTTPEADQIVVRVKAVAINPVDCGVQAQGDGLFPWLKFPLVLGEDVAGDVVEVGSGVTRFKKGDRVVGHAVGALASSMPQGAFQTYSILLERMVSRIPATVSYESASVIPLGFTTAVCGLFQKDFLSLPAPSISPEPSGKTLLIWGGSTSVGCNAIQLAKAAGYGVITTGSHRNHDYLKKLGADEVYDYNSSTIQNDLLKAFEGKVCGGALAIAGMAPEIRHAVAEACLNVVAKSKGDKFVALTMPMPDKDKIPAGVGCKFIFASTLKNDEGIAKSTYGNYLGKALEAGSFTPAPQAEIVGVGLESIQTALERMKEGVSARKLVVTL